MSTNLVLDPLARVIRDIAVACARRPRTVVVLWLAAVVGLVALGTGAGSTQLTDGEALLGESAVAQRQIERAGLDPLPTESFLIRAPNPARARAATIRLAATLDALPEVASVAPVAQAPRARGGRSVLLVAELRRGPGDVSETVVPVERALGRLRPQLAAGVTIDEAGEGSVTRAVAETADRGLRTTELLTLPVALVILLLTFGAIVAALVPLLLGVSAVAAALGAVALLSPWVPVGDSTASVVVLIGLAVGIDYSLFCIRREREERAAGRGRADAIAITMATVGRAVFVAATTVVIALAGMLFTGSGVFTSMAVGAICVVAIALLGAMMVLPASLTLLGDRVDAGRPGNWLARVRRRPADRVRRAPRHGAWARFAASVTRRPLPALLAAVALLTALALPALGLRTADTTLEDLPDTIPQKAVIAAIERDFPGGPAPAVLVATGSDFRAPAARRRLTALGAGVMHAAGGNGSVELRVARDGRTAVVLVPAPIVGSLETAAAARQLRAAVRDAAPRLAPGADVLVTGPAAAGADFADRLSARTPIVVGFVLALAFLLLLGAFRSLKLAAIVIALNALSVGAAYGVLAAVFQHTWAERLLGFHSTGAIASWLPLLAFTILFGLSVDYTVIVLERIREERVAGHPPRAAAARGVVATAGTVTGAAAVMVAVFAMFATMSMPEIKQMGVGLAAAVLLDATIVRGVALPAAIALLGDGWRVRRPARAADAPRAAEVPA